MAEDVARVRAASDLVAIAGEHIALKRVGRQYQGLCPFHAEKSPSFSVNPALGVYYCFGCQASGDAITFVREVEHLDFAEAVERLAARAGLQVRYDEGSGAASAERKRLAGLREALGRAIDWYHQRLLTAPDAAPARHYLRAERGYDGEVVRAYQLGWAPEGWDTLARALKAPNDVLRDTGLGFVNARGRVQDSFRGRVLFPIFDVRGEPVGIGGRALPGDQQSKYKNSPETPLYKKSRVLYGLNWAKGAMVERNEVVVCEGYTDVIGLQRAGVEQAVATCGTAFGEDHVQVLKNFARRLVLAYDADAAGQAAAERVYEWERKHDIDVAVAAFPPGEDPADLARRDPEALRGAVAGAKPFVAFRLDRVLEAADLRSVEGRARAAEAGLKVIAEHPSDLVRHQYIMELAGRTRIDHELLRERIDVPTRAGERRPLIQPTTASRAEIEALRVAVHRPEEVADRLHQVLFAPGVGRRAYHALANAETLHDAIDGADEAVAALLRRVAVEEPFDSADAALAMLVWAAVDHVRPTLPEPEIPWVKRTVEELSETGTQRVATDRLVRWLVDREEA